jgi:hypothetical protein
MIAQHRTAIDGFLEARIGGVWHVLKQGRWVVDTLRPIRPKV